MIICGDSAKLLKDFESNSIDLTVTSPPYDDMRSYNGNSQFDFETIAKELFRITKDGGVVVWIIGDKTENGTESCSSFKQVLYFRDLGFNLHDTMIFSKGGSAFPSTNRYRQTFEYMFILSKGKPKTFNPIKDRKNVSNKFPRGLDTMRGKNDEIIILNKKGKRKTSEEFGMRFNIWHYGIGVLSATNDKTPFNHPAMFPEKLAEDHIKSWSNEGDTVLDPFLGSGTTYKMALKLNRKPIGIEINPEYMQIAKERIKPYLEQSKLV